MGSLTIITCKYSHEKSLKQTHVGQTMVVIDWSPGTIVVIDWSPGMMVVVDWLPGTMVVMDWSSGTMVVMDWLSGTMVVMVGCQERWWSLACHDNYFIWTIYCSRNNTDK